MDNQITTKNTQNTPNTQTPSLTKTSLPVPDIKKNALSLLPEKLMKSLSASKKEMLVNCLSNLDKRALKEFEKVFEIATRQTTPSILETMIKYTQQDDFKVINEAQRSKTAIDENKISKLRQENFETAVDILHEAFSEIKTYNLKNNPKQQFSMKKICGLLDKYTNNPDEYLNMVQCIGHSLDNDIEPQQIMDEIRSHLKENSGNWEEIEKGEFLDNIRTAYDKAEQKELDKRVLDNETGKIVKGLD